LDEENKLVEPRVVKVVRPIISKVYEPPPVSLKPLRPSLPGRAETIEREEPPSLLAHWRVLRKRRWTVLTVLFVLFTVVLIGTLKQKPIYQAQALLEIEKERPNIVTMQDMFELVTISDSYLETQYKILRSETLAQRVIEQLRLDQLEEFNPGVSRKENAPEPIQVARGSRGRQATLARFRDRLTIDPVKRSRLVEIRFESEDPVLAASVVNALANSHIEQSLQVRWEATQKASEWLSEQLLQLKARLEKSENELQAYARQKGLLFLESEKGIPENIVNERLRQLQEELSRAQAARYEKEPLYRLVQAGDYGSLPGVADNKLMQELTVRLAELRREQALLGTTFTPDYYKVRQLQSQIDEIEGVLTRERRRAAERITNEYLAASRRETLVQQAFEGQQKQANLIAERSVQYNILKREVETNKQLYEGLLQRLKEAGVSAGLKASNIRIVDVAEPPKKPAKPNLPLNLALGLVLGLSLGVGAAFLQEHLDNSLKTSEDVERYLALPALALIPAVESLNGHRDAVYGQYGRKLLAAGHNEAEAPQPRWYRIDGDKRHSALGEAFRSLRTSVLLSTADQPPRTLLVSSSQPGEGKTTISANLAISLAQLGRRVLLIDGDMRRPSVRKVFETPNGLGLVSYLTGQQDWRLEARPAGIENLYVLACGPVPPNPAELLSSERMRTLLEEAKAEYQFVLVDSPPLLNVADSRILATMVEGVVLVVKGGTTPRELAQRAQTYARDVGANLIGVVLNNLDVRSGDDYYYRYYHYEYYGSEEQPEGKHRP
jgi:capsular exopolysaccharide synthesis family protein